jgi:hypothetical protein
VNHPVLDAASFSVAGAWITKFCTIALACNICASQVWNLLYVAYNFEDSAISYCNIWTYGGGCNRILVKTAYCRPLQVVRYPLLLAFMMQIMAEMSHQF